MTTRLAWRLRVVAAVMVAPLTLTAPAHSHDEDETSEGYLLVQQALAHLSHDASPEGIELAMEKVSDALRTDEHQGMDSDEVRSGMDALEAGQVQQARARLEDSITVALANQPLASGYETGTRLVSPELPGRGPLGPGDLLVLGISVVMAGIGGWLSVRFRPHDSMSALRLLVGGKPRTDRLSRRVGARSEGIRR